MLVKQIVANILKDLESLPRQKPINLEEQIRLYFFSNKNVVIGETPLETFIDSEKDFEKLSDLLNNYKTSDAKATSESLPPIIELLQQRSQECHLNYPQTLASKAYLIVAKNLALILPTTNSIKTPTLKSI